MALAISLLRVFKNTNSHVFDFCMGNAHPSSNHFDDASQGGGDGMRPVVMSCARIPRELLREMLDNVAILIY